MQATSHKNISLIEAQRYCRRLARAHYENFTVGCPGNFASMFTMFTLMREWRMILPMSSYPMKRAWLS